MQKLNEYNHKLSNYYKFLKKEGVQKVFENFTWLSVLQLIERFANIIVIPYLIRRVGMEKWGLIAFAQSFILYFGTVIGYGFHLTGVKDISQNRNFPEETSKIFYSILATKFFLLLFSALVYFSIVFSFKKFQNEFLLFTFNFFYILGYCIYPDWFFQGIERMKFSTIFGAFARITYVFLIFIFIKKTSDYLFVPLLNSISVILMGLTGLLVAYLRFNIKFYLPNFQDIIFQLKKGWHIFLSQLYLSIYSNSRVFVLGIFTSGEVVGNYALAEKIINIMGMPLGIFSNAVFPRLSLKFKENLKSFKKMFGMLKWLSLFWGAVLCAGGFLFGKLVISIFAGGSYSKIATFSFNLLLLGLFFNQASVFLTQYFVLIEKPFILSRIYLMATILGVVLFVIMTPLLGYRGIVIASCIVEITIFVTSLYYGRRERILVS